MHSSNRSLTLVPVSLALAFTINSSLTQLDSGASPHAKAANQHEASEKSPDKPIDPPIENVINVSTNELVEKPRDYLNKNVKFNAKFFAFSSLALDYKPALRTSKTHLSFLVLRPEAHVPYSELKLAMPIPKEKDPESSVLTSLKDGDPVEIIGRVFATPLDEPWMDVMKLKRLTSPEDDKKAEKKISSGASEDDKKKADSHTAKPEGKDIPPKQKDSSASPQKPEAQ